MVKALFGDIGSAGGHQAMAKAVVPLKAFRRKYGSTRAGRIKAVMIKGFLEEIECAPVERSPLIRGRRSRVLPLGLARRLRRRASAGPRSTVTVASPSPAGGQPEHGAALPPGPGQLSLPASAGVEALRRRPARRRATGATRRPAGAASPSPDSPTGTSIVEVTDPARPRNVALIPGPASQWREIRTYGEYVYVTTEARLGPRHHQHAGPRPARGRSRPGTGPSPPRTACGSTPTAACSSPTARERAARRGMRVLDVGPNPEDPQRGRRLHRLLHPRLLHAAATSCSPPPSTTGSWPCSTSRDPRRIREITRFFTGGRFTHNSWLTGDGRYLFTTDERTGRPAGGLGPRDPTAPAQGDGVHRRTRPPSPTT